MKSHVSFRELLDMAHPMHSRTEEWSPLLLCLHPLVDAITEIFPWVNPQLDAIINTNHCDFQVYLTGQHKMIGSLENMTNTYNQIENQAPATIIRMKNLTYRLSYGNQVGLGQDLVLKSDPADLVGGLSTVLNAVVDDADYLIEEGDDQEENSVMFQPFYNPHGFFINEHEVVLGNDHRVTDPLIHYIIQANQPFWVSPRGTAIQHATDGTEPEPGSPTPHAPWIPLPYSIESMQFPDIIPFQSSRYPDIKPRVTPPDFPA